MRKLDLALTLAVCMMWGLNFVAIKWGLETYPALLLAALRFTAAAVTVLLVPVPPISWNWLIALGMIMFAGQFGFLYTGIRFGMPAGMASVLMQMQVFLTVLFASLQFGLTIPRPTRWALAVSFAGLLALAATADSTSMTWPGLLFTLCGATCWAIGNLCVRSLRTVPMLPLMAWLSLVPPLPLLALSLLFDGPAAVWWALTHPTWPSFVSILFQSAVATIFCYGGWSYLIVNYGATTVAPFALTIPISGLGFGWLLLGEQISGARAAAIGLIFVGLIIHVFATTRAPAVAATD